MHRTTLSLLGTLCVLALALPAQARDTAHKLPIAAALEQPAAKEQLNQGVRFYFGDQSHPSVQSRLGQYTASRKTNAFGKSDEEACRWVFLSSLIALRDRALAEGGNAVINIHSYYDKQAMHSATEYECQAGAIMAGVALRGEVVRLAE